MTDKKAHHHGNLRAALIEAGLQLIADGGPDALSIRQAAALAGVSHAAPAHHFASLSEFRTAIMAEGYRRFAGMMKAEIARAPNMPRDKLMAAGRGYLAFALQYPGLFQLVFGGSKIDHEAGELQKAGDEAYDVLRGICAPLEPGPAGPEGNELLVWSIVHGFASLVLAQRRGAREIGDPIATFEAIFPDLPFKPEQPEA